jgi:DNA-directed RNA polymerase alpha subunit
VLTDEFLANRLSLVPLDAKATDRLRNKKDCDCDFSCRACSVRYKIDVTNTEEEKMLLTSAHIELEPGEDPDFLPLRLPDPIVVRVSFPLCF